MKAGILDVGFGIRVTCFVLATALASHASAQTAADIARLRQAAEKGDMAAAYKLGVAYRDGTGVPQDYVEAAVWIGLAGLLATGDDGQRHAGEARELEQKLTPAQSAEAMKRGLTVLRSFAAGGHSKAQFMLGTLYFQGAPEYGVPQDYAQAFDWLRKAATQGDGQSAFILGKSYEGNWGTTQDYAQAAQWYRKAAEEGNPDAQLSIGVMYEPGLGVARDLVEAHKWVTLASVLAGSQTQNDIAAAQARIAKAMTPEQLADAQKRAREWMAAFEKRK